ncbi:unnamed protein product [Amaranthus hypochondriacus]
MKGSIGDVNVGMISSNHHRQENLLAAYSLFKELEANDSLPDNMKKTLAGLCLKLSDMELTLESNTSESVKVLRNRELKLSNAKEKLKIAHEKIRVRELNPNMIWDLDPEMVWDYIHSVEEIVGLLRFFRSLCVEEDVSDVIAQAEDVLLVAMLRFEEGLVHILNNRRQSYVPSEVEENVLDGARSGLNEQGSIVFDLIDTKSVRVLKSIRRIMFDAKYDKEFCGVYVRTQKYALEECLVGLGMETMSIDELIKMRSDILAPKIKKWTLMVKIAVLVYFSAEKRLCDEIFEESDPNASLCLFNITKSFMMCFFNFGQAIALGPHTPEKLFYFLDMYEGLAQVRDQIDTLFGVEEGFVRTEFEKVMNRLGDSARATFLGFGDEILSDPSTPLPGGGVHPLSSYVMNYIIVYLPDYCKTLETLLQEQDKDGNGTSTNSISPEKNLLASHLRSIVANLKSNLEKKSQSYKDTALQHVFLMNNTRYIQQKVIGSELQNIFGDKWIRTQIVNYQKHATSYVRTTWSSVVAILRNDGIPSGSGSGVKLVLKEKIGVFIVAFEEVYRSQTGWIIRDEQLKEELRISISQKVILAYQSFIGRHKKFDIEKYVKYDSDDLENLLRDFFEGSQKSLNYRRR